MLLIETRFIQLKTAPLHFEECQECPCFRFKKDTIRGDYFTCALCETIIVEAVGKIHKDCPLPIGRI
jgi:hypothetical protein